MISASSYIFLEEEEAHHFYILRKGSLRAMIGGKLLTTIMPGQFFGEIAVLNESFRTGSVHAEKNSRIVKINGRKLLDGNSVPVDVAFRLLKELIKPVISLHYTNDLFKRTKDIIRAGESDKVEFKSTLRFNLYTGKFGKEIEHAALKTVAAFLNAWGGILIIGVDDQQNILRTGPSTTDLKPSMIYDYIENRFFRPRA